MAIRVNARLGSLQTGVNPEIYVNKNRPGQYRGDFCFDYFTSCNCPFTILNIRDIPILGAAVIGSVNFLSA